MANPPWVLDFTILTITDVPYEVIGKFLDCYCCNCLGERRWEGRPRSQFRKSITSVCHWYNDCFYTRALSTRCFLSSAIDGKIKQRVCIKFCVKLGKSAKETFEMLHEACREHSLTWTAILQWYSRLKAGWVSAEDDETFRAIKHQQNAKKNMKKFENSSTKTVAEKSMSSQTSLGSVIEFARRS
jgi:hypothetical protein